MRTPDIEGVATRDGPESCAGTREGAGEALTGVRAGRVSSLENSILRCADALVLGGRQQRMSRQREGQTHAAWSKTPCTHASISQGRQSSPFGKQSLPFGSREIPGSATVLAGVRAVNLQEERRQ